MSDDFDWSKDASIAVCEQPALAVYPNDCGHVVIRRERTWDEEEDCVVLIAKVNVLFIVRALLVAADMEDAKLYRDMGGNEYFGSCEDIEWPGALAQIGAKVVGRETEQGDNAWAIPRWRGSPLTGPRLRPDRMPKPKDATAAERQRRHRANKSKLDRDTVTVTPDERDTERDAPTLELVG